jgi:hypothetical protein
MEETTLVKWADVWVKGQRKKYNLKEQHFDKSKSVLHACEEGPKSD